MLYFYENKNKNAAVKSLKSNRDAYYACFIQIYDILYDLQNTNLMWDFL